MPVAAACRLLAAIYLLPCHADRSRHERADDIAFADDADDMIDIIFIIYCFFDAATPLFSSLIISLLMRYISLCRRLLRHYFADIIYFSLLCFLRLFTMPSMPLISSEVFA